MAEPEITSSPPAGTFSSGPQLQADGTAIPTVGELLAADDPRVCGHPDTIAYIRTVVMPTTNTYADEITDEEFQHAVDLVHLGLTKIEARVISSFAHEISCEGNLSAEREAAADVTAITFRIKPSATPNESPIFYLPASSVGFWPMDRSVEQVKSGWPSAQSDINAIDEQ